MRIKIRYVTWVLTFLSYLVLVLFLVVASLNYKYRPHEEHNRFHSISELIDNRSANALVYLLFVTFYTVIKLALIALSLLDVNILQSELFQRRPDPSERIEILFYVVSYVIALFAIVQLVLMISLVFVPIGKTYHAHIVVAALLFLVAWLKSLFYLIRRSIIYERCTCIYILNIVYLGLFLAFIVKFHISGDAWFEYLVVFFILWENVLLSIEFYYLNIILAIELDEYRKVSTADKESRLKTTKLFQIRS